MPKEIANAQVQIESSVKEKLDTNDKQCVDESADTATKRTVVLDQSATSEDDDTTLSSVLVVMLGVLLLIIGAVGFYYLPGMIAINAKGSKVVNSIYCSVITLTTYVYAMHLFPGA
jgi:sterol desaturase/sphingolipid hydroxylase (fatty acid hydroxylase superfamily)